MLHFLSAKYNSLFFLLALWWNNDPDRLCEIHPKRDLLEIFLRAKKNQLEKNEMISLIKHNMVYVNHNHFK